jgi:outer membrane protein assembly factor BamE
MIKKLSILFVLLLSACVYRLDIQQGNILDQKDIDKLRVGLTKNQVVFVLGTPVVNDSFSDDKWVYLYNYKKGKESRASSKKLVLMFKEDSLISANGDYEIPDTLKL